MAWDHLSVSIIFPFFARLTGVTGVKRNVSAFLFSLFSFFLPLLLRFSISKISYDGRQGISARGDQP
jgi:hypothetical protein